MLCFKESPQLALQDEFLLVISLAPRHLETVILDSKIYEQKKMLKKTVRAKYVVERGSLRLV